MRLTVHTDYALRTLIYVALRKGRVSTVGEIARSYGISRNHLVKVVHRLGQLGYVETVRGKGGGIRLALAPAHIRIGQLVRRVEDDMRLVECFRPDSGCCIQPACILRRAFREALSAFLETLDDYTLEDLVGPDRPLVSLLSMDKDHPAAGAAS